MKLNLSSTLSFFIAILFSYTQEINSTTVIHAGLLIDGTGSKSSPEISIVIEDGLISSIEAGFITPDPDDDYIDLGGYTVLPGLMDMHVHLASEYSAKSYTERISLNPADYAIRGVINAKKTLLAGFTTVRNLGDSDLITISLRNAINEGLVEGPRIFSSGKTIASSGGHGDRTNSLRTDLTSDPGPKEGIINNKDDAFKAVRYRYKEGADLIKITATGGVLSVAKDGQNPQLTAEEILSVVKAAKDYGFKVAAHAHGAEGIKRAVKAGVSSIEHGTFMDGVGMELMREKGTYYVPTIIAGLWVAEKSKIPGFFPDKVKPKAERIGPKIKSTFAKAYQSGVKIAFGTDSGVSAHGDNATEFKHMVEAGMPPMKAIEAATMEAAKLLGVSKSLGSISVGKIADIIAVNGDPLDNISVLEDIDFVMKEGVIFKSP